MQSFFITFIITLLFNSILASDLQNQYNRDEFIAHARTMWNLVKDVKENLAGPDFDKQVYCQALQNMLNYYPDPKRHIWQFIYTGNGPDVPEDVSFMQDIHRELMWAFETDNI
jgi:hypothetical protein